MHKYPTLSTLNEILVDSSNPCNDQADRHKQPECEKDSIASYITLHSNIATVGNSTKLPRPPQQKTLKITLN